MNTLNNLLIKSGYEDYQIDQIKKNIIKEIKEEVMNTLNFYHDTHINFLRSNIAFNIAVSDIKNTDTRKQILKELHKLREKTKDAVNRFNTLEDPEVRFFDSAILLKRCNKKYADFLKEIKDKKKAIDRLL